MRSYLILINNSALDSLKRALQNVLFRFLYLINLFANLANSIR